MGVLLRVLKHGWRAGSDRSRGARYPDAGDRDTLNLAHLPPKIRPPEGLSKSGLVKAEGVGPVANQIGTLYPSRRHLR
jgi:hypothetical protein